MQRTTIRRNEREEEDNKQMSIHLQIAISVLVGASIFGLILWRMGAKCLP